MSNPVIDRSAPGVRITVLRGTISSVVMPPAAANDSKAAEAKG